MRVDILTIFPEIFDFYFNQSLLGKAQKKGVFAVKAHNLRKFAKDKHKTARPHRYAKCCGQVDDKPFGGGRGMVLKIEPIMKAVQFLKKSQETRDKKQTNSKSQIQKSRIVLFSPRGKKFTQKMATKWSKLDQVILVCGRYEAIDERVAKYMADEVVSMGDYVLMGGEVAALAVVEAIARLLPGAVGNSEALITERITKTGGFVEYPQYTRPEIVEINGKKRQTPKVLLSGHHKEIEKWRAKNSKIIE